MLVHVVVAVLYFLLVSFEQSCRGHDSEILAASIRHQESSMNTPLASRGTAVPARTVHHVVGYRMGVQSVCINGSIVRMTASCIV